MTDPKNLGFHEPLDADPLILKKWQGGVVESDAHGDYHRVWYRSMDSKDYLVLYDSSFEEIKLEIWVDGNLESVPVEATIEGFSEETEDFLDHVGHFFDMIEPHFQR